jgi:hypothetical protein
VDRAALAALDVAILAGELEAEAAWDRIAAAGHPLAAKCGYSATTGGAVALGAGTAKSILGMRAGAAFGIELVKMGVYFDGVTATAVPVLVELCAATFATNAPGTGSTAVTAINSYGRPIASGMTAAKTWTSEPTVLSVLQERLIDPNKGNWEWEYVPQARPDVDVNQGFVIRCNAPAAVNVRGGLDVERI